MSCDSSDHPSYCSRDSPELKLYQVFIFSAPVLFIFILLLLFYVFYLRRRASWQSMRMRASELGTREAATSAGSGIDKEVREMLPVVVFTESFFIREIRCSVCLGDYQSEDRLQKIPQCGHTFHINCIDHWLSTKTTCPLCRVSLLPPSKAPPAQAQPGEEAQLQELSDGDSTAVRVVQQENVAEVTAGVCSGSTVVELDNVGVVEDCRIHGEASVAITIDSS